MTQPAKGKVYLVGAGPGDPGLLTLKGKACISRADVLVYDYLANPALLGFAKAKAELIYVGKKAGVHTLSQDEINSLIVKKALAGGTVVRLKGGDPFIFGRGGEEAQELAAAGIDFEFVPGVTSAIAVPAYAGIPLTHRDHTATVAFITGHEDPRKDTSNIAWDKISTAAGTLVFLMGVGNLAKIAERLVANGRPPDTPVAVIRRGTEPAQRTIVGTLGTIARIAEEAQVTPPAIIVVGQVVRLRETLNWFEKRPLFGKRIVVTRAREQASGFMKDLAMLGAECIEFPTIRVVPPDSWEPLDTAIGSLPQYRWVLFTSVNGVKSFLMRLEALGKDVRELKGCRIGAIGPKTAEIWKDMGIRPDLMPDEYRAEAVIEAFRRHGVEGARILLPRALEAREILPESLREMGALVDVVPAYRTVLPDSHTERVGEMLKNRSIHMVTFTSSSTVRNFVKMFEGRDFRINPGEKGPTVACIGPVTAKTAEEHGFRVDVMPDAYTIEALTESIVAYFGAQ
ncbi:MAG: uroporphyrinogen-III C-methyltransferase [Deltaproteobacteria bacterium]|nr:uroporphyrinogen-III C-methyltransferase [Deltaproteobacteria bacterium]